MSKWLVMYACRMSMESEHKHVAEFIDEVPITNPSNMISNFITEMILNFLWRLMFMLLTLVIVGEMSHSHDSSGPQPRIYR